MGSLNIPVRYYRDFPPHYDYAYEILSLKSEETAFLLVDVDGGSNSITEKFIVPALTAAREIGLKVAYVHNDLRLVADPGNIVEERGLVDRSRQEERYSHTLFSSLMEWWVIKEIEACRESELDERAKALFDLLSGNQAKQIRSALQQIWQNKIASHMIEAWGQPSARR